MFTLDQIKTAHAQVKSGAEFPAYIRNIKKLGVAWYVTFVQDGYTEYSGNGNFKISSPSRYPSVGIAATCNASQFKADLKAHQQGRSDYPTFIRQCADLGVHKWVVDLSKMTCTYFDVDGNEVLVEQIPQ